MVIKKASLTDPILMVVQHKGTEPPFSGIYNDFGESGTYLCRQCGLPLFRSQTKFHSGCGWASFDEEIKGSVLHKTDINDGRTEILCNRCQAHLGHIFLGEGFTAKDARYCVNSLSLDFIPELNVTDTEEAIFAAGCFWGVEYYFKKLTGILKTEVGYIGGHQKNPTYHDVCANNTGHYEAIRVIFDPNKISYRDLTKYFFEIHNPEQTTGQGPDIGQQYLSGIFYYNENQKKIANELINELKKLNYFPATKLLPVTSFWRAEDNHQNYYQKTGTTPYCHQYNKKFIE